MFELSIIDFFPTKSIKARTQTKNATLLRNKKNNKFSSQTKI